MIESKMVHIATIKGTDRLASPIDEPAKLIASIKEHGIKNPILVTDDMVLIDGLRRVRAAQTLGIKEVPVIVARTFAEIMEHIPSAFEREEEGIPLNERWVDVVFLYRIVKLYGNEQIRLTRIQNNTRGQRPLPGSTSNGSWRMKLNQTLECSNSVIEVLKKVVAYSENPPKGEEEYVEFLVEELKHNRIGYSSAWYRIRHQTLKGAVVKAPDQVSIIDSSIQTMTGVTRSLKSLGPLSDRLSKDQLNTWRDELNNLIKETRFIIRVLERNIGK